MSTTEPFPPGATIYAVTSTGVFCRPQCPSRPPLPENVRFFAGPPEARTAGFRACKRCRPEAAARSAGDAEASRGQAAGHAG